MTNTLLPRNVLFGVLAMFASAVMAQTAAGKPEGSGKRYLTLDDAAVAMAKAWQRGEKAKPIMSDDGKVVFAFGQSMPKLTCSPTRACDVEMQPGEKINKVILGDKVNWSWAAAESTEKGQPVLHVVIQPRDNSVETNAIITTDRRTYHIRLYAPKQEGVYLNRVGFYYPDELVESWEARAGVAAAVKAQDAALRVTERPFSPEDMDSDYKISGSADFKPLRVFNTGKQVYIEMPRAVFESGEAPMLLLLDDDGKANVVNYRMRRPQEGSANKAYYYMVDKLFTTAELRLGKETVTITWGKKAGWSWGGSATPWVFGGS